MLSSPNPSLYLCVCGSRCLPSMNCWHLTNMLWSLSVVQHFDEGLISKAFARVAELAQGDRWPGAKEGGPGPENGWLDYLQIKPPPTTTKLNLLFIILLALGCQNARMSFCHYLTPTLITTRHAGAMQLFSSWLLLDDVFGDIILDSPARMPPALVRPPHSPSHEVVTPLQGDRQAPLSFLHYNTSFLKSRLSDLDLDL